MIHKYTLFGYNIVLDAESGAVHVISDISERILSFIAGMVKKGGPKSLPDECPVDLRYSLAQYESSEVFCAYSELLELCKNNLLFSECEDGLEPARQDGATPVKALCLNVSHACNLVCGYCFAQKGDFGLEKKFMDEKTGMNAVEFLMKNSQNRKNLEIDFFGGEPLLNFETIRNIVINTRRLEKEYGKNVRFTLTTNGILLDSEKIDFINENISNIVLSLDGLKKTNDEMRKHTDGGGSYDEIVPLYQKLTAERTGKYKDYYIRGTFTRKNLNFSDDAIHMRELGFSNISIEPVAANEADENIDYAIKKEDLPLIFKEYEKLAKEIIKREKKCENTFNFFHFNIDLENGPCIYKRIKGCGSGSEYIAVTPDGDIYPCHQFVGNEKYKLGNVNIPGAKLDCRLTKKFYGNNIFTNEKCKSCWVKYFCGGGCPANNVKFNGDIYEPCEIACEMEKKRVECAIAIKAALS